MSTIKAKGTTKYGDIVVTITGDESVKAISTGDKYLDSVFWKSIKEGEGSLANNYHPEKGSMLQAYAFCRTLFREKDISVNGDIGEIDSEEGVIY